MTFAKLNEHNVTKARVVVGERGPWVADVELEGEPAVSGAVTLTFGDATLHGTIVPSEAGTFGGVRQCRVLGGAGGWETTIPAKDYHNDAGVKALTVIDDAARACGESLGSVAPAVARLGKDYVRSAGPAARALERAAGATLWWVDFDGLTYVGARPSHTPEAGSYTVLLNEPMHRHMTLSTDSVTAVRVGSVLSAGLDAPETVTELEIYVTPDDFTIRAYTSGPLASIFRAAVARVTDTRLFGKYRYRVLRMSVDRVECQVVRKASGVPDLLPVSMWPGVAGCHATLAPGAELLVEFIEGDPTMPIVTHFAGKDGTGFQPIELVIGGPTGPAAARVGDPVTVTLPPAAFSGTVGGLPATGTVTWAPPKTANGTITGGSGRVKIAT